MAWWHGDTKYKVQNAVDNGWAGRQCRGTPNHDSPSLALHEQIKPGVVRCGGCLTTSSYAPRLCTGFGFDGAKMPKGRCVGAEPTGRMGYLGQGGEGKE